MITMCNATSSYKMKRTFFLVKIDGHEQSFELKTKRTNPEKDGPQDSVWYIKSQSTGTKYHVFKLLDQSQEMLLINIVGPKQAVYQAYEEVLSLISD